MTMKKLEMTTDSEGRQTIIVPDGMEVVVKDNGDLMLVEKQDIFETMKPGDIFVTKDGIYIFKFLHKRPEKVNDVVVYGWVKFGGNGVSKRVFTSSWVLFAWLTMTTSRV